MNVLLEPPSTVRCVVPDSDVADEITAALQESVDDVVATIDTGTAPEWLDAENWGCLVVHDGIGAHRVRELCESVRGARPDVPIVIAIESGATELATDVAVAGACAPLFDPDPETLRTVVADRLDRYVRRRTNAEESEILTAMLDGLETPLYAKDTEARHVLLAEVRGGLDPEAALGKTDLDIYLDEAPEFARQAYEDDTTVLETETPVLNRDESHGPEGSEHWSRTTKVPWYGSDGQLKGLVGISHDISELKRKEERLEEVRDRFQQFAQHLSRDLQNPLQVASGYLEMARSTGDGDALDRVEEALDRMSEMIDDMSTVASHRGAEDGSETTFDFAELVETLWSHMSTGDAVLQVDLPTDYLVHGEKVELRPLVETLLRNAVEGVPVGGASGEPTARRHREDLTVTVGLTDDLGFYVTDDAPVSPSADDGSPTESRVDWGLVDDIARRNDWHIEKAERSRRGTRIEVRNCLGARDRSAPDTLGSHDLTETTAVGTLQEPGRVEYDEATDEWLVAGDGEDIWRQYNDFKFAYARVDGPVRIQGHITDVEHVNEFSKAGLMIRDDLDTDATYGYAGTTPTRGSELLWRTTRGADGTSQQLAAEPFPVEWYRLDRVGDRITAWLSTDGQEWDTVDERRIDADDPVFVGLAVSSVVPGVVAEATFRDVSVETLDV